MGIDAILVMLPFNCIRNKICCKALIGWLVPDACLAGTTMAQLEVLFGFDYL